MVELMKCRGPDIRKIRANSKRPNRTTGPETVGPGDVCVRIGFVSAFADI
jgi:hypothetical protein